MAKCKQYDLSGNPLEDIELKMGEAKGYNEQMVKNYIVALRNNARQWSANTKGRSESHHSGAKPHRQKGTGKARQGFLGAPHYKGGGRVGTPKPKFDQHVRINRKERKKAIVELCKEKIQAEALSFVKEEVGAVFPEPKTKKVASFLQARGWEKKRVLFVGSAKDREKYEHFTRSMTNLGSTSFLLLPNINAYDILVHSQIVVFDDTINEIQEMLA